MDERGASRDFQQDRADRWPQDHAVPGHSQAEITAPPDQGQRTPLLWPAMLTLMLGAFVCGVLLGAGVLR